MEPVSDLIDASHHPEKTYVPGTQLFAGQSEKNVPGGLPDTVPGLIDGICGPTSV